MGVSYNEGRRYLPPTSATLVEQTIFHFDGFVWNTFRCSSLERFACSGRMSACFFMTIPIVCMHCLISCTPGRKTRIPPFGFSFTMWPAKEAISYK